MIQKQMVAAEVLNLHFLHGNPKTPIFQQTKDTCDFTEICRVVFDAPEHLVCDACPTDVDVNAAFVVHTKNLGNIKNIFSDDMGSWEQMKTKKDYVKIVFDSDDKHVSEIEKYKRSNPLAYTLTRKWYLCKSPMAQGDRFSLKKVVASINPPDSKVLKNVFIQYLFLKTPKKVIPLPHGNSKSSKPYIRTMASTTDALKNEKVGAKRALFNV